MDSIIVNSLKSLIPASLEIVPGFREFTLFCVCAFALIAFLNMRNKKKENDLYGKRREVK